MCQILHNFICNCLIQCDLAFIVHTHWKGYYKVFNQYLPIFNHLQNKNLSLRLLLLLLDCVHLWDVAPSSVVLHPELVLVLSLNLNFKIKCLGIPWVIWMWRGGGFASICCRPAINRTISVTISSVDKTKCPQTLMMSTIHPLH